MRYLLLACFTNDDIPVLSSPSREHIEEMAREMKRDFEIAGVVNSIPHYVDEICDKMLRDPGDAISIAIMTFNDFGEVSDYEILHSLDT